MLSAPCINQMFSFNKYYNHRFSWKMHMENTAQVAFSASQPNSDQFLYLSDDFFRLFIQ